jgi:phage terminase small subunit
MDTLPVNGGKLPVVPATAEFRVQKELANGSNNTSKNVDEFDPKLKPLTFQEEVFIKEYVKDFKMDRACRRAGLDRRNLVHLLHQPNVRYRMDQIQLARSAEAEMDHKEILKFLYDVMRAELSDVMEHYRGSCRYCWGHRPGDVSAITHEYHYRTQKERIAARKKWEEDTSRDKAPFSNGGLGYDKYRAPNPDCPECSGDGISQVLIKDTNASGPARQLVSQIVINSAGKVEVKLHDKLKVAELLMRHLGMLNKDSVITDINVRVDGGLSKQIREMQESGRLEEMERQVMEEAQRKIGEV